MIPEEYHHPPLIPVFGVLGENGLIELKSVLYKPNHGGGLVFGIRYQMIPEMGIRFFVAIPGKSPY